MAVLEKGFDAGFLGQAIEMQQVEQLGDAGTHEVGEQPADEEQQQGRQQLRDIRCQLRPERRQGRDEHIELLLHDTLLHYCGNGAL